MGDWASVGASSVFSLWNLIIRPPRKEYTSDDLGPTKFEVNGIKTVRRDTWLKTPRGTVLACSHFEPAPEEMKGKPRKRPVIVYLHGNSSCRLEAWSSVSCLISRGMSLFCYDASGCGHSGGEYISLGWHERDDLATVIQHLRKSPLCGPIGLWGRSMGAVTTLLHASRDHSLGALCLDSPFANLRRLAEEVVALPAWLMAAPLEVVRARVQALAGFDINDLEPEMHVPHIGVPGLFIHASGDGFVTPEHSRTLFNAYGGHKQLAYCTGDHNSQRGDAVYEFVGSFFVRALKLREIDLSIPEADLPRSSSVAPPLKVTSHQRQQRQDAPPEPSQKEEAIQPLDMSQDPDEQAEPTRKSLRCLPVKLRAPKWASRASSARAPSRGSRGKVSRMSLV